jgi:hypothetical protein
VVASDTPFVEPELLDEKKEKGRGEERLSNREYKRFLVARRNNKRSGRQVRTLDQTHRRRPLSMVPR